MANWYGLVVVGLLIGTLYAEQDIQQKLDLGSSDLASEIRLLQKNVTDIWAYIYRLRHAIELHLTSLATRQTRLESTVHHQTMHSGHDSHGHDHHEGDHSGHDESGHRHEPLTSSGDHHHHDDHGSSDHHHHDDHGSSDPHHDDHSSSSDHHHGDHGSSDHHHDDHGSSDHHDDHHHHDSHSTSGDHHQGEEHHSHHDEHHHHSSSDSHTHDHDNHTDSDHDDHHHGDDHHDSHEKDSHGGDHQHSHEHKDSKAADDEQQQSVEDIEKPFTATVVRTHGHGDHGAGTVDKIEDSRSDPLNLLGGHSHSHHHHHHHHSHQDRAQQTYDAKVTIPKFSESRQYIFATCDVQPNRVIAPELQQEVTGQVSFWQKKSGGPLNIHVRLRGFAIGDHHGHHELQQEQTNEAPVHKGGHRHGFHIHEFADLSAGCQSTGSHYNPFNVNHGGPKSSERHLGDLGNIECDDHGVTNIVFPDTSASLTGENSIVGRALVIHADVDDYGVNKDDPESLKTGNAGTRIACCVLQKVDKFPLSTYRSIKSATNYQN